MANSTCGIKPGTRLLIAGGGTGGHVYPGLAVAEAWSRTGGLAAFIGSPDRLEGQVVPAAGYRLYAIKVLGFTRGSSRSARIELIRALALLITLRPLRDAFGAFRAFRPDVVLGVGGYVSGPALLAARIAGIPTMALQIDASPGIANRLIGWFATRVGVALAETAKQFPHPDRVVVVGNPIRQEVIAATREEGLSAFQLEANRQTVLVFGGSLGSRAINQALCDALRQLGPEWARGRQVIHVTGRRHPISLTAEEGTQLGLRLITMEYCDRLPLAQAAADLVVSRSGATTIAELTARGVAALLIPWSGAADNHQEPNARALEDRGAARVLLDDELNGESLARELRALLDEPDRLRRMAAASRAAGIPDAAARVVQALQAIAKGPSSK